MRNRLPLYMNELSLEEILYLQEELDRRRDKHRRHYAVLSVQADRPVLRTENAPDLTRLVQDMRRYISSSAAAGGGTVLTFAPEVSIILFNTVESAGRACSALLGGLPELNGRAGLDSTRIGVKMGLASGIDTLAPGSPRSVRASALVRRASQIAWRGAANALFMDQNSYHEWRARHTVIPTELDMDGQRIYRVMPGMLGLEAAKYDNEALMSFLNQAAAAGVSTLKYGLEHRIAPSGPGQGDSRRDVMHLCFEGYDAKNNRNLTYAEAVASADIEDRLEVVKVVLTSMNLALVRHELSVSHTL